MTGVRSQKSETKRGTATACTLPGCSRCTYFVRYVDIDIAVVGACHHKAPVLGDRGAAVWPHVCGDDWCGDFALRPR